MEHAVGEVGVDDVAELPVAVEVAGGRAVELGEKGEGGCGDWIQEQSFVKGRRRRERGGRLGRRFGLLLVGWRGWSFLGGRGVGGGNGLRRGAREGEGCGEEKSRQKRGKSAEGRAKGLHGSPLAGTASRKLYLDPTEWADDAGGKTQCMRSLRVVKNSSYAAWPFSAAKRSG